MYGRYTTGSGVRGSFNYVFDNGGVNGKVVSLVAESGFGLVPDGRTLDAAEVADIIDVVTAEFNSQAAMNNKVTKPVRHAVLSLKEEDRGKVNAARWEEIIETYLERMGVRDTQYVAVEHKETNNPHVHIIFNAVNNEGKRIDDRYFRRRSAQVCRELTKEYGLTWGNDKIVSKVRDFHSPWEQQRYEMARTISEVMPTVSDIEGLKMALLSRGIMMQVKQHKDGRCGVVFCAKGQDGKLHSFSGKTLSQYLTYSKIAAWYPARAEYLKCEKIFNSTKRPTPEVARQLKKAITTLIKVNPETQPHGNSWSGKPEISETEKLLELCKRLACGLRANLDPDEEDWDRIMGLTN